MKIQTSGTNETGREMNILYLSPATLNTVTYRGKVDFFDQLLLPTRSDRIDTRGKKASRLIST